MIAFGDLKTECRGRLYPTGEAPNLVAAHDKMFVDALIDIQTFVECAQQDNVDTFDQCATYYKCGLTMFTGPRGVIRKLSVVDQINEDTHLEDPEAAIDYCAEVEYHEIDFVHFDAYRQQFGRNRALSPPLFFGFPGSWQLQFPPTDAGLPTGLKPLDLGVHYAQPSTDRVRGTHRWRSRWGVWAKERGNIWVAPWIQSTERIIVKWDGIKRTWADDDPTDDDPLLISAIEAYVRWKNAARYDQDQAVAASAAGEYNEARTLLIHQCREETRVRDQEVSHARSSVPSLTSLYYNTPQTGSASCPDGTGTVSATISAGTVNSTVSVADANQKAKAQANAQAQAQLNCGGSGGTFQNAAQSWTAICAGKPGSPSPEGDPVTVTIPAGTVSSAVSQADADAQALALAQQTAGQKLACRWWNSAQPATAVCPANSNITATETVAAHTVSSQVSQDDADARAKAQAQSQANTALQGCGSTIYWNSTQLGSATVTQGTCVVTRTALVDSNQYSSIFSQADANSTAKRVADQQAYAAAQAFLNQLILSRQCG